MSPLVAPSRRLPAMVEAIHRIESQGGRAMRLGIFHDTSTLANDTRGARPRGGKADLTKPAGTALFPGSVLGFFEEPPPEVWARLDGPHVFPKVAQIGPGYDDSHLRAFPVRGAHAVAIETGESDAPGGGRPGGGGETWEGGTGPGGEASPARPHRWTFRLPRARMADRENGGANLRLALRDRDASFRRIVLRPANASGGSRPIRSRSEGPGSKRPRREPPDRRTRPAS